MNKHRRKGKPPSLPQNRSGLWKRVKLWVAGGGLLASAVGAYQFVGQVPHVVESVSSATHSVRKVFGWQPKRPYELDVRWVSIVPQSLLNVMSSQDFLYWFWLSADNRGPEPLHLVVEIEVLDGPATPGRLSAGEYWVWPGQPFARGIQPAIRLLKSDVKDQETLRLIWRVTSTDKRVLGTDTLKMTILPKEFVHWGLQTARGKDVPRDFLVASLAAWVLTPDAGITQHARELLARAGADTEERMRARRWMQLAYEALFSGQNRVKVRSERKPFPPRSTQAVMMPTRVFGERRGTAMEAALLLAAHRFSLGPDLRSRLAMVSMPASEQQPEAEVFVLAWSADGSEWEAIELDRANTASFEDNRRETTARARGILERDPRVAEALGERGPGVFLDDKQRLVALSFWRAHKYYNIRALP